MDSNFIGTTISGMSALGNTSNGVYIGEAAHDNQVWDNLISGNETNGACIVGYVDATTQWFTDRHVIGWNIIGLAANRTPPLPNGWYDVSIGRYGSVWILGHARENVIVPDTISWNGRSSVMISEHFSNNANADRNRVTQNSIFANCGLGIDLDDDGVTMNNGGDPDQGADEQWNMPVIASATWLAGIGSVPGSGTTNAECRYTFIDPLRDLGTVSVLWYRIAQIDFDGMRDYSPEALVELAATPSLPVFHAVWPKPASGQLFLRYTLPAESEARITFSDVSGREVLSIPSPAVRAAGAGTLRIDTEILPVGSYELVYRAGKLCEVQWVRIVR